MTEERPYPHLLLHRSAGPALPQPVRQLVTGRGNTRAEALLFTFLNKLGKVSSELSCQCTAHATTSVDIGRFKSESFPHTRTFSLNNTKFR